MSPSKHKMTVLSQIFKLIPRNLIPRLAREHGVDKQARTFSPVSHVLALMFGQLSHAMGLNDVCDTLQNHSGVLTTIREGDASEPQRIFSREPDTRRGNGGRFILEGAGVFGVNKPRVSPWRTENTARCLAASKR